MSWIGIALVVVAVVVIFLKLSQQQETTSTEYPYMKMDSLFTPAERSFLGVLTKAAGDDVCVFGKVRVADVIRPKKGLAKSDWQSAFNKISAKHFDYLLCKKDDMSILCAIELDDSSHKSKKRKKRDAFLRGACQSADLPFVQIPARPAYTVKEIYKSIADYLPRGPQELMDLAYEESLQEIDKICPKCSSAMVKRTAKKGKSVGDAFWACSAFPKCRYTEAITA